MSGEVKTKETFTYGKFIAKMKGDDKLGTCTSFFTFWKGNDAEPWDRSNWSEIDIELVPSAYHGTLSTNIIWAHEQMNPEQIDRSIADPQDDWAVYEFQWTPDWIAFLHNGVERRKVWRSPDTPEIEYMEREQHLMMNFWIPDFADWNEGFDGGIDMPWYARYDYVEYWEYVPPAEWESTPLAN
jgi:endoglucanase